MPKHLHLSKAPRGPNDDSLNPACHLPLKASSSLYVIHHVDGTVHAETICSRKLGPLCILSHVSFAGTNNKGELRSVACEPLWKTAWQFLKMSNTEFTHVKGNEDQLDEKSKAYFFRLCYSWGVSHHHLCFGSNSKAGRELRELHNEKGKSSDARWLAHVALESWRWDILYAWCGSIFGLLWLVLCWELRQKLGRLSVINQVLLVWGLLFQQLLLTFWIVTKDSNLASFESDLQQAGSLSWLP